MNSLNVLDFFNDIGIGQECRDGAFLGGKEVLECRKSCVVLKNSVENVGRIHQSKQIGFDRLVCQQLINDSAVNQFDKLFFELFIGEDDVKNVALVQQVLNKLVGKNGILCRLVEKQLERRWRNQCRNFRVVYAIQNFIDRNERKKLLDRN